jgi:hypothetical protein
METTTMYEIANTCYCEGDDCFGYCWDDAIEQFSMVLDDWFVSGTFRIEGFPVWYGTIGGLFDAKNPKEFLRCVTPERTEWILRYNVEDDKFVGILSHHDGTGTITVVKVSEE